METFDFHERLGEIETPTALPWLLSPSAASDEIQALVSHRVMWPPWASISASVMHGHSMKNT